MSESISASDEFDAVVGELTAESHEGFPNRTLGDLVDLVDAALSQARICLLSDSRPLYSRGIALLKIVCQAQKVAVVRASINTTRERLELLDKSLHEFDAFLEDLIATKEDMTKADETMIREYHRNGVDRMDTVKSLLSVPNYAEFAEDKLASQY